MSLFEFIVSMNSVLIALATKRTAVQTTGAAIALSLIPLHALAMEGDYPAAERDRKATPHALFRAACL